MPRAHIIYGKIAATASYMLISMALTLTACAVALQYVRLEELGMSLSMDALTTIKLLRGIGAARDFWSRTSDGRCLVHPKFPRGTKLSHFRYQYSHIPADFRGFAAGRPDPASYGDAFVESAFLDDGNPAG